ncbi:MAG: hypothetical protein H6Q17_1554 [Bacteroidetes bacterium]|nr:hypothetical protein [Bacteroidota bacterium]
MKLRLLLLFVALLWGVVYVFAQREINESHLLLSGSSGYCQIKNGATISNEKGNVGFALGTAFERQYKSFLFQTGIELSLYRSTMSLKDTLQDLDMVDTEDMPFRGHFTFTKTTDLQQMTNVAIPLMVGYESWNGYFVSVGGKAMLNLAGNTSTSTRVNLRAYYPNIIGENNDGGLSDMPNHGLSTVTRAVNGSFKLSTLFVGSIECGYTIPIKYENHIRSSKPKLRLSLFCDYGIAPVKTSRKTTDLFVNTSNTGEVAPAIRSYLFNDMKTNRLNIMYTGIKATIVFDIKTYECFCDNP